MNKEIDKLLENYLAGQSSLQEENRLKEYFNGDSTDEKYHPYRFMFQAFAKSEEIMAPPLKPMTEEQAKNKSRKWIISISTVAAACVLALFALKFSYTPQTYLIVNGKRIENQELVKKYAQAKIEKYNAVMEKQEKTIQKYDKIKNKINTLELKQETYEKLINKQ